MGSQLEILFTPKEHPYKDEASSGEETWGAVEFNLISESARKSLLYWEWDILSVGEWFAENHSLLNEIFPFPLLEGESLAEALTRHQERDFVEEEEQEEDNWFQNLYEFRKGHSLRFMFRGASVPDIIIGNNKGRGEVSFYENGSGWKYDVDLEQFLKTFKENLNNFFTKWHEINGCKTPDRYTELLEVLNKL